MLTSLLLSALLMGLAGGPHCLAMCGSACMGMSGLGGHSALQNLCLFQTGRLVGYATLGAVAAVSMNTIGWLASETPLLHPVWSMMHVAAVLWGLWLIWHAEQPMWLSRSAHAIWRWVTSRHGASGSRVGATFWMGMVWALLPCGLLYSALLVAAFTANALEGALVMAMFALGGGLVLTAFPWLWSRINRSQTPLAPGINPVQGPGQIGVAQVNHRLNATVMQNMGARVSGLLLVVTAGWGLWSGLSHMTAPWCLPA